MPAAAHDVSPSVAGAHDVASPDAAEQVGARSAVEDVRTGAGDERVAAAATEHDPRPLDGVVLAGLALHRPVAPEIDVHGAPPARVRDRSVADDDVRSGSTVERDAVARLRIAAGADQPVRAPAAGQPDAPGARSIEQVVSVA